MSYTKNSKVNFFNQQGVIVAAPTDENGRTAVLDMGGEEVHVHESVLQVFEADAADHLDDPGAELPLTEEALNPPQVEE